MNKKSIVSDKTLRSLDKRTIWNESQNKPSLIVDDLLENLLNKKKKNVYELILSEEIDNFYEILLRRGVFKWFAVRRKLIRLKNEWKDKITKSISRQKNLTDIYVKYSWGWIEKSGYERGYRKALEDCRKEIRALCHSDRWQCPDNDSRAREWFYKRSKNV